MTQKRGLGRGLGALIPGAGSTPAPEQELRTRTRPDSAAGTGSANPRPVDMFFSGEKASYEEERAQRERAGAHDLATGMARAAAERRNRTAAGARRSASRGPEANESTDEAPTSSAPARTSRSSGSGTTTKVSSTAKKRPAAKSSPAKSTAAKSTAAKSTPAKSTPAKKSSTASKSTSSTSTESTPARSTSTTTKSTAKKTTAPKSSASKSAAPKSAAPKTAAPEATAPTSAPAKTSTPETTPATNTTETEAQAPAAPSTPKSPASTPPPTSTDAAEPAPAEETAAPDTAAPAPAASADDSAPTPAPAGEPSPVVDVEPVTPTPAHPAEPEKPADPEEPAEAKDVTASEDHDVDHGAADDSSPAEPTAPGSDDSPSPSASPAAAGEDLEERGLLSVPGAVFAEIPIHEVRENPRNPRTMFDEDELDELAYSLREVGVLQPVVVRPIPVTDDGESFELVMGERRWRAARRAGLQSIPAIIRETSDDDLLRDALLENLHRTQLNPLEEANAYQQLLEDFGCTQDELGERIGRSRPQITNTLRLLRLPALVQRRLASGAISAGHARALLSLDDPALMEELAQRIVQEGLSVRAVERLVARGGQQQTATRTVRRSTYDPHVVDLTSRLSNRLEAPVRIDVGKRKGRITLEFTNLEDLERLVENMGLDVPLPTGDSHEG